MAFRLLAPAFWISRTSGNRFAAMFQDSAKAPTMKPIVAYYRVSTQKQARSGKKGLGLGLEAQREALSCSGERAPDCH